MILRAAVITIAAVGLFWFPWPLTLALIVLSGLFLPVSALVLGLATDVLYHPFSLGVMPYGVIVGIVAFALGTVLRTFFASRIMSA